MENKRRHCSSAPTDRKLVERNRRNEMKALYSRLFSLVPHQSSREAKALPDRLEDAIDYIKKLQTNVEQLKEKREMLLRVGNPRGKRVACSGRSKSRLLPEVEVHQVGSAMEVVLVTGSDYHFIFSQTLRMLQEEGAEILNVSQSMFAHEVFHKIVAVTDAEVVGEELNMESQHTTRIRERVKEFVSKYEDTRHNL